MFGLGFTEIVVILVVALLVFGPTKLPELARSLGKGLAEFRRASADIRSAVMDAANETPPPPVQGPADQVAAGATASEATGADDAVPDAGDESHADGALDDEAHADGAIADDEAHADRAIEDDEAHADGAIDDDAKHAEDGATPPQPIGAPVPSGRD